MIYQIQDPVPVLAIFCLDTDLVGSEFEKKTGSGSGRIRIQLVWKNFVFRDQFFQFFIDRLLCFQCLIYIYIIGQAKQNHSFINKALVVYIQTYISFKKNCELLI